MKEGNVPLAQRGDALGVLKRLSPDNSISIFKIRTIGKKRSETVEEI